jgi:single-strand DNA-binding protein
MVRDIATATLSGNLTSAVELRELPSGAAAARLRLASASRRRDGDTWADKTNYYTVEAYGPLARLCAQRLRKGSRVVVDAELDWREWTDSRQQKREAVTLKARQILFEGGPAKDPDSPYEDERNGASTGAGVDAHEHSDGVSSAATASADDLPF